MNNETLPAEVIEYNQACDAELAKIKRQPDLVHHYQKEAEAALHMGQLHRLSAIDTLVKKTGLLRRVAEEFIDEAISAMAKER